MALIMTFDAIREFFHAILRSEERMEWETVSYGLTNIWIVIFGFILLAMHPTVRGFTVAYAAGTALGALGAAIISRKYLRDIWGGFSGAVMRKLMHSIWPYTISSALGMLMINTDIIMLGWFRSSTEVGWYSAPQRIVQLIYLIPSVISVSILPTFSRLAAQSREKMTRAIEQGVSVMYMAALPVAVGGIIVAIPFTQLLFGPAFTPGAVAFQILLLSLLADFSAVLLSNALLAQHRQKKLIIYSAIGGSLNVGLNLLLIPKFGLAGCAVATLGAQIVSNSYLQYTVRQIHPFHIWRHLRGAVLGTFAMALTVFFLQMQGAPVVLNIAIGALIYGGVLVLRRDPLVQELQQGVMGNLTPQSLASTAPASRESNAG